MTDKRLGRNPLNEDRTVSKNIVPQSASVPEKSCQRCSADIPITDSPPKCAFTTEIFSGDNWCCRTLRILRSLSRVRGAHSPNLDHSVGLIDIPFELSEEIDGDIDTHIMLQWYKDRGRTNQALIVSGNGTIRTLDRVLAEKIVDHYENLFK
jgi:hypothetical protein